MAKVGVERPVPTEGARNWGAHLSLERSLENQSNQVIDLAVLLDVLQDLPERERGLRRDDQQRLLQRAGTDPDVVRKAADLVLVHALAAHEPALRDRYRPQVVPRAHAAVREGAARLQHLADLDGARDAAVPKLHGGLL